jgi:ABC-2 type transport system permease protein
MPPLLQKMSYANPLRHIMVLLRSVYLKGAGFDVLWPQVAALASIAILLLAFSVLRFHKSLE